MRRQVAKKSNSFKPVALTTDQHTEYLANKKRGGANFQKGSTYENRFAVGQLAELVDDYLNTGADVPVCSQMPDFYVDDLVIGDGKAAWQLKNVAALSWGGGGKGTVGFDFYHQLQRNKDGTPQRLELVVSDKDLADSLTESKPTELASCTVAHFPDANLYELISTGVLSPSLSKIARTPRPSTSLLKAIAHLLLGSWWESNGSLITSQLVPLANKYPCLLRSKLPDADALAQVDPAVAAILQNIPGFSYTIERGFFHSVYAHTETTLNFDCFSPKFKMAQRWILDNKPTEYDGPFEDALTLWSEEI